MTTCMHDISSYRSLIPITKPGYNPGFCSNTVPILTVRSAGFDSLCIQQKIIFEYCGIIVHKNDACIIRGHKFLPSSIKRNMNYFNSLRGDEQTDPPREWNIQPTQVQLKPRTSPPKTSPVVLPIMVSLTHHAVYNGVVDVYPSEYLFEYTSNSVPYPDTTPIKSIDDNEMY